MYAQLRICTLRSLVGIHQQCRLVLSIGLLVSSITLFAQPGPTPVTTDQLFATAWTDSNYTRLDKELAFFQETNLDLPLLEEIELRTKTRDFQLESQQYTTRFEFNSFRERKAQRKINNLEYGLREMAQEEALEALLYERYRLAIEQLIQGRQFELIDRQRQLLTDQERHIELLIGQYGEKYTEDWLKLKDNQLKHRLALQEYEQERQRISSEVTRYTREAPPQLVTIDILPAEELAVIGLSLPDTIPVPAYLHMQALEVGLAQAEAELEKAGNQNLFEFLQLRYRGDRDPTFPARVSVGAAVRLPLRNANSIDEQYSKLEEIEEDNQLYELIHASGISYERTQFNLQQALVRYESALTELQEYQSIFGPAALQSKGIQNVETILLAREGVLLRQHLVVEREGEVYSSYLELLHASGCLTVEPYRNWLTNQPLARF